MLLYDSLELVQRLACVAYSWGQDDAAVLQACLKHAFVTGRDYKSDLSDCCLVLMVMSYLLMKVVKVIKA